MYKAVKALAPATVVVWAPNLGSGYPFGQTANIASTDLAVLDTNKNGQLDAGDDPYTPYYPGDDYVDWIGLSVCRSSIHVQGSVASILTHQSLVSRFQTVLRQYQCCSAHRILF